MARSGYEVAKFLSEYNNEIIVTDCLEQNSDHVKELEDLGIKVIITKDKVDLLDNSYDYVVKNPGVKYNNPFVVRANELGIKVINELEMSYKFLPKNINIIGVTGSNGKTTVVTLIYNILKEANKRVHLCGNIGYPVSSIVSKVEPGDILVVEISDHQLCDMYDFKTDISVLTNICETHIDFHDSYDRYKMMKKRIFNNHTVNKLAIINHDDLESLKLTEDIISKKIYFGNETDCYIENEKMYYLGEEIISLDEIKLKGIHNYENIMATILTVKQYNISNEVIKKILTEFNGVEHRLEYVTEFKGRKFYNDSKSTNNKSLVTAINSFTKPLILIMGGLDRGQCFDELNNYMSNVKYIICYGETKDKIKEFANKYNYKCHIVNNLISATKKAYNLSKEGDIILLSPACASWDQYKCFEDRGNEFKQTIIEISNT